MEAPTRIVRKLRKRIRRAGSFPSSQGSFNAHRRQHRRRNVAKCALLTRKAKTTPRVVDEREGNRCSGVRSMGRAVLGKHLVCVTVIGSDERHPPARLTAESTCSTPASTDSTAATAAGMTPVCPTMSQFAKFTMYTSASPPSIACAKSRATSGSLISGCRS